MCLTPPGPGATHARSLGSPSVFPSYPLLRGHDGIRVGCLFHFELWVDAARPARPDLKEAAEGAAAGRTRETVGAQTQVRSKGGGISPQSPRSRTNPNMTWSESSPAPHAVQAARARRAGVAQSVEHLFCKQVVRGSSPLASSGPRPQLAARGKERTKGSTLGGLPEWPKGAGCKPAGVSLRWFESNTLHPGLQYRPQKTGGLEAGRFVKAPGPQGLGRQRPA